VSNADPKGYYAVLNVAPTADPTEILLAYKFLRASHREGKKIRNVGKIQEAWTTLGNPDRRAQYDQGEARRGGILHDARGRSRLNSSGLLVALSLVFVITFGIVLGPDLLAPLKSYDVGDDVYWKKTRQPIGVVIAHDDAHPFPEGATQAAYQIRSASGVERWFAAADLHRHGKLK